MLTLKQINEVSFRKSSFSGYKPEDVDDFIDEVSESFTALLKENQAYKAKASELASKNAEMREKMVILAEKIDSYRDDEDGIKNALLSAQKLGAASIKEAKKKAEYILSEASVRAEEILNEAKSKSTAIVSNYESKIAEKEKEFDTLKAAVTTFRSSLYDMYRSHITAIESIPDFTAELKKKEKAAPAPVIEEPAEAVVETEEITPPPIIDDIIMSDDEMNIIPENIEEFASVDIGDSDQNSFDDIDLNAYSDIPETLKKEKESMYSTLEFGEGIDIKK